MAASAPATKARPAPKRRRTRPVAAAGSTGPATRPARAPAHVSRIPVAVSRTAGAVGHIPDLGIVHRLARGRAWILLLGLLLTGIVAINVVTLSLTASTGKMEQRATALEQQNSALEAGLARQLSNDRVEAAALGLGMVRPIAADYAYVSASTGSAALAAERATAAVATTGATGSEEPLAATGGEAGGSGGTAGAVPPASSAYEGTDTASAPAGDTSQAPVTAGAEPDPAPVAPDPAPVPSEPPTAAVEGGIAVSSDAGAAEG